MYVLLELLTVSAAITITVIFLVFAKKIAIHYIPIIKEGKTSIKIMFVILLLWIIAFPSAWFVYEELNDEAFALAVTFGVPSFVLIGYFLAKFINLKV